MSSAVRERLKRFKDWVFFVHGTSLESANDINFSGVSKDAILEGGKGSLIPGAFFTFLLEPNPIRAIELASGFAQAKQAPHAISVGKLPLATFLSLISTGQAVTRPLLGAGYDETVFFEPAFPTLDFYNLGRCGIAPIP